MNDIENQLLELNSRFISINQKYKNIFDSKEFSRLKMNLMSITNNEQLILNEQQKNISIELHSQILNLKKDFQDLDRINVNTFNDYKLEMLKNKKYAERKVKHFYESLNSDIQNRISFINLILQELNMHIQHINYNVQLYFERKNTKDATKYFYFSLLVTVLISILFGYVYYFYSGNDLEDTKESIIRKIDSINIK